MLAAANRLCLRFWRDESGVVLATTVVVFLTVLMMAFSVYAVGEITRERVEIQNAADAAAYSGAIVQADTISRVAAINRAMSWTHAHHIRMEMDAVVDRWLEIVVQKFMPDYNKARAKAFSSECMLGPFTGWDDWYCGQNYFQREHVRINRGEWYSIWEIIAQRAAAAGSGKSWNALLPWIQQQHTMIKTMNDCEVDLLAQMKDRIYDAVKEVVAKNVSDTENDTMAGGADFMFQIKQEQSWENNFEYLHNTAEDEEIFMNYSDLPMPEQYFSHGSYAGQWFPRNGGGDGIQREYVQRYNMLVAEWNYYGMKWKAVDGPPFCVPSGDMTRGRTEVKGDEGFNPVFYVSERCFPLRVKKNFFAQTGSIKVGVCRRVNNPCRFLYYPYAEEGIFKPFTLDHRQRFMWAVAAAIAGHNVNSPAPSQGRFFPTWWPPAKEKKYNLKYSDWDAVLLPLHRAEATGVYMTWDDIPTGGKILSQFRGGSWEPITGGGGLGAQGGPELMSQGSEVSYGAAEGWIVH